MQVVPPARPEVLVEALLLAAEAFDATRFDALLDAAFAFGRLTAIRDVVLPTLVEIGTRWERADITVGHEHFASHLLGAPAAGRSRRAGRPVAVRSPCWPARPASATRSGSCASGSCSPIAVGGSRTSEPTRPSAQIADVSAWIEPDVVDPLRARRAAPARAARRAIDDARPRATGRSSPGAAPPPTLAERIGSAAGRRRIRSSRPLELASAAETPVG